MLAMPNREGWTLLPDNFKTNGEAFHRARREANIPGNYTDKATAEKNAATLSEKLGFRIHVCECIY